MTVTSARYANADNTAAECQTTDRGTIMLSAEDTPDAWTEMLQTVTPSPFEPCMCAQCINDRQSGTSGRHG